MNNISQISKAKRLTEEEVHAAAAELQANGSKVGSIDVYRFLGRGSLTTITNFLKTWHQEEKAATNLPALVTLPETLKKTAEQMIVKIWAESQALAEQEIKSQQEALRQAEALANEKIAEAEAFSEEQAQKIEALEAQIEELKKEKAKDHDYLLNEEKRLQTKINDLQKSEGILETRIINTEKQLKNATAEIEELKNINTTLAADNVALKTKLEAGEQKLEMYRKDLVKAEEVINVLKDNNQKAEIKIEVQHNQINQLVTDLNNQEEKTLEATNENKVLREKAAKLEGELKAWKEIKPEAKKYNVPAKKANKPSESTEV